MKLGDLGWIKFETFLGQDIYIREDSVIGYQLGKRSDFITLSNGNLIEIVKNELFRKLILAK